MADNKPGTDLERRQELVAGAAKLVNQYRQHFTNVVPSHIAPDAFIELALAYVKRDPWLLNATQANPASLILALRECGAKGHMPIKGIFSLVPFQDHKAPGGWSIVGMEEWRGVVERIFRAGGCTSVHVHCGRERDPVLRWNPTKMVLPEHEYDEHASKAERGPLKAVYAWARMLNGSYSDVAWLNRHEVERHRSMSKSIKPKNGPEGGNFWGPAWPEEGPNTEAMWKKTALHTLEGLVPTSAEYRWALAASEAAGRGWAGVPDTTSVTAPYTDVVDAEPVEGASP